jgi:hypothetical protein
MRACLGRSTYIDVGAKSLNKASTAGAAMPKKLSKEDKLIRASGYRQVSPNPKGFSGISGKDLHPMQQALMTRNVEHAVRSASPDEVRQGMDWYKRAHDVANEVGRGNVRKGAGIIAALSPQTEWTENVRMARQLADTGNATGYITRAEVGKAKRILEGEDPETVLPMQAKTGHFFRNINDPSDPSAVTIDRHAHDLAMGRRYGANPRALGAIGRYQTFVGAHMSATHRLSDMNLVPNQTQAISWVRWRNLHGLKD